MNYQFVEKFKVRDYECDLQGIVNNAVYQHYLEHARHEFLLSKGINFAALAAAQLNLVVIRAELDYIHSLTAGDAFYVGLNFSMRDRVRGQFEQAIYRQADKRLCVSALIGVTATRPGRRPGIPAEIVKQLLAND